MDSRDAEQLTLLDDATAVFVYLSSEGLKKIKPLLLEAAKRRRHSHQDSGECHRLTTVQEWKDFDQQETAEEFLLEYGGTEHPKRKSESDFLERRKKIPQNFYPIRFFRERIDKSSLFLYNEFRISI